MKVSERGDYRYILAAAGVFLAIISTGIVICIQPMLAIASIGVFIGLSIVSFIVYKPARTLLVFMMLLPIHQLVLMTLFHFSNFWTLVKLIQPWKDVLALSTLLNVAVVFLFANKWIKMCRLDRLILLYFFFNLLYIFGPWDTSLSTRLLGLRTNSMLVIFYFLGRVIPLSPQRQKQFLIGLMILGGAAGLFSIIDRFLLPLDWPARIGLTEYLLRSSGAGAGAVRGRLGLSWTYWTSSGLRRASSFFANPLDLAASSHLTGVAALALTFFYPRKSKGRLLASTALMLVVCSLLLSISRTSTIAFIVEVFFVVILLKRYRLIVPIICLLLLGSILVVVTSPGVAEHIYQTLTFENPSSQGHLDSWKEGLQALLKRPYGFGLGTSGRVGALAGSQTGGENQYIILAVELGFAGLFLYILIGIVALGYAYRLFKRSLGYVRIMALVALVSHIGMALAGLTANIEIYIFLAYIHWWLIGFVSQKLATRGNRRNSTFEGYVSIKQSEKCELV